ncbi:MAG: D-glycero-beta-D-manno-heptose 1-phosphate adenylyltransferase [Sedimentisphaerales bacterium]|nr:D-glycero-beta-D-manno-heptose 1-phosphate adenylyltransferase [Sedimentisphaerales bacterium]
MMYDELIKAITTLGSPKVLVVGDFMLDVYIYGDALRISPEAPVPVLKIKRTEYNSGGAGSVAVNLSDLGAVPYCIGVIGDDENGIILKEALVKAGADVSGLFVVMGRPTITKQRLIGLAQHRHQQQLFRMDREVTEPLNAQQYQDILSTYKTKLTDADIVCLEDYNKGFLNDFLSQEMIRLAKKAGKKILVDPPFTNDYSKYTGATLITPNRQEASTVVGFDIDDAVSAARAAEELVSKFKLEAVVITLDKEGAYLRAGQIRQMIPTRVRSVYDVTGAGDVVLATLAASLAGGCDYRTAVQLSNIAGGIEVGKFGAVSVTVEEILNETISQKHGKDGKVHMVNSLKNKLGWHRRQKQVIVFTNGCFDIIHTGHIEFLKFCKSQGDVLVVGLNSDSSVRQIKGSERPINNQYDRAAVLAAFETVDYVTFFDEPDPLRLIKEVEPDVLVKGQDWAQKGVVGREFVESNGGKVVLAPIVEGKSTTATIEKMKSVGNSELEYEGSR